MFTQLPTGAYTYPEPYEIPAIYTENQAFYDNFSNCWLSINGESDNWIRHPVIIMMLQFIHHYTKPKKYMFSFEQRLAAYNSRHIQEAKDNQTPPNSLFFLGNTEHGINIRFLHVKRGHDMFAALDTFLPDVKMIAAALQQNRHHKLRIYKDLQTDPRLGNNTLNILTTEMNWTLSRKIIALLPILFPNFFEIPEKYKELLTAFGKDKAEYWLNLYIEWAKENDIFTKYKKEQLINALKSLTDYRIATVNYQLSELSNKIRDTMNRLDTYYRSKQTKLEELFYLENNPSDDGPELFDFLQKHKYITDFFVVNNKLILKILAPVAYYDKQPLNACLKNKNSFLYDYGPQYAEAFKRIFIDEEYTAWFTTGIIISFTEHTKQIYSNYLHQDYIAQPHLMYYNCFGDNDALIKQYLHETNYLLAIEQIVASTLNLNFTDSTVIKKYLQIFAEDPTKYLGTDNKTKEPVQIKTLLERCVQTDETNQTV
jgi:hypothetical protein